LKKKSNHIDLQKHLTQAELLDYTNGVLGNDEMYRLELHLNECGLCSEALDGIALVKDSEVVLTQLNRKLFPKQKKTFSTNYITIAASIALITVFWLSYWFITKPNKTDTIALNTPIESITETTPIITKETAKPSLEEVTDESEIETPLEEESSLPLAPKNKAFANKVPKIQVDESKKQKTIIKGKEGKSLETSDQLARSESQTQVMGEMEEDTAIEEVLIEPVDADISLSEEAQPMLRASKRSKKSGIATSVPPLKDQKEPLPVGGMEVLKSYINQNLQYPQEALDNNIKGTVVLEVSINNDGSVNTISVIKGLGFGCDAEAMRLIANGPKWTPKVEDGEAAKATQQVKIKFKN